MVQDTSLRGAKVVQGEPKYLQGGGRPPPPPPPPPPLPPFPVTLAYYWNFVKYISSSKMRFITLKKKQNNYSRLKYVLFLLLPHLFTYFSLQTLQFLLTDNFLPQGAGYPSYVTRSKDLLLLQNCEIQYIWNGLTKFCAKFFCKKLAKNAYI